MGRRASGFGGSVLGAAKGVGFGLAAAGGFDLANALGDVAGGVIDFDRQLTNLQVTGEMSTEQLLRFREEVLRASAATGVSTNEMLAGASAYVGFTGNAQTAASSLELFGRVAKATNAPMSAIAGVASVLDKNMHIDPKEWGEAFDILIKQGHMGGVELEGLAADFPKVGAMYSSIFESGGSAKGLREVGAMSQVLQNMTHDSAQTSTFLTDMFGDIVHNAKGWRALGIEPFRIDPKTKKKVLKDGMELIHALAKTKAAQDPELLGKLFPEKRGRQAIDYLMQNLGEADKINEASTNSNQTAIDFATKQASASGKIEMAFNRAKVAIMEAFTPERAAAFGAVIEAIGNSLAKAIGYIGDLKKMIDQEEQRQKTGVNSDTAIDVQNEEYEKARGGGQDGRRARAVELRRMAAEAERQGGAIDEDAGGWAGTQKWLLSAQASGYRNAADALAQEAAPNQHGDYQGVRTSTNNRESFRAAEMRAFGTGLEASLVNAVERGLARATVVVKANANEIAKVGANAQIQGLRPGGKR